MQTHDLPSTSVGMVLGLKLDGTCLFVVDFDDKPLFGWHISVTEHVNTLKRLTSHNTRQWITHLSMLSACCCASHRCHRCYRIELWLVYKLHQYINVWLLCFTGVWTRCVSECDKESGIEISGLQSECIHHSHRYDRKQFDRWMRKEKGRLNLQLNEEWLSRFLIDWHRTVGGVSPKIRFAFNRRSVIDGKTIVSETIFDGAHSSMLNLPKWVWITRESMYTRLIDGSHGSFVAHGSRKKH